MTLMVKGKTLLKRFDQEKRLKTEFLKGLTRRKQHED